MAKGSSTSRVAVKTSADLGSTGSSDDVQSSKTLTSSHEIVCIYRVITPKVVFTDTGAQQHLDRNIKQAIQLRSGRPVKAFVVLALQDNGEIVTHTTDHVQQCTEGIFTSDAKERLRIAHERSTLRANHDRGSHCTCMILVRWH